MRQSDLLARPSASQVPPKWNHVFLKPKKATELSKSMVTNAA